MSVPTSKMYIMDKYFTEMQKLWDIEGNKKGEILIKRS